MNFILSFLSHESGMEQKRGKITGDEMKLKKIKIMVKLSMAFKRKMEVHMVVVVLLAMEVSTIEV